jgi:hypothetical protein
VKRRLDAVEPVTVAGDQPRQGADQADDFRGPWFTSQQARRYVGCASLNAWYHWRNNHGIIARSNGTVAKVDLDRELRKRSRRGRHPHSLANLLPNSSPEIGTKS